MDRIAVLDFGGQYAHLIANRIRRLGVYSEILECATPASGLGPYKGIILSGGPRSVTEPGSPRMDPAILDLGVPVLGLCYGHQLISLILGGAVARGDVREYGIAHMDIVLPAELFKGLGRRQQIWMSHGDTVTRLPDGFAVLASTPDCPFAAVAHAGKKIFGLQFHPEVTDTPEGMAMLGNFIDVCGCAREWNSSSFIREIRRQIERQTEGKKVFMLVSGGVDSSVAFLLLNTILGPDRVIGLHIDNGLMRKNESGEVMSYMREHGFENLRIVDASDSFLDALAGVADPEAKRAVIGTMFITVQQRALAGLDLNTSEWLLGQGTIYPDTIESAGTRHADRIKTHHNRVDVVRELIEKGMVIEPLAQLYKDEVRHLGETLGLPRTLVWRHPFPGPGLGVRVLCSDATRQDVDPDICRRVSALSEPGGYRAQVLAVRSVGVQGDGRTYAHPVLLTGPQDWNALEKVSTTITNTVPGVNRILFGLKTGDTGAYRLCRAFVTRERLDLLREIDHVATELLHRHGQYDSIWQMPVVLLPLLNAAGDQCVVLRPLASREAMTARFVPLKQEVLDGVLQAAARIKGIGDVFIDITNKPPGTIEWE